MTDQGGKTIKHRNQYKPAVVSGVAFPWMSNLSLSSAAFPLIEDYFSE